MEGGSYSIDKFRKAQETGKTELPPEELAKLEKYEALQLKMGGEAIESGATAMPVVGLVLAAKDLFDKDRRAIILGAADRLKSKRTETTEAGQLEAAQDEAEQINEEYDKREWEMLQAVDNFARWRQRLNGQEPEETAGTETVH